MGRQDSADGTIHRGYAANAADEKRLRALGVKVPIYRGDKGEVLGKWRMRKGEVLTVVRGYLAFGSARRDWVKAEETIHGMGAVIFDLDSGLRSDRNGAAMVHRAIYPLRPTEEYQRMQALSAAKRVRAHKKTRRDEKIWLSDKLKVREKVELIGIPVASLYRMYGKTGAPQGRRKK